MSRPSAESDARRDKLLVELRELVAADDRPVTTLQYGSDDQQVADLRVADGPGPHPVAVLVHGGNWHSAFDRRSTAALAVDLARRGWATWNIEYRRVGNGGGVLTTLQDIDSALELLAGVETVDRSRLVLVGHSAGGQLALVAARRHRPRLVVSLAGYCDLAGAWRDGTGDGAVGDFCGGSPDEVPGMYDLADPMRLLPLGSPAMVVHGVVDDRVPAVYSERFAQANDDSDSPCDLHLFPDVGHFEPIDPRSTVWLRVVEELDRVRDSVT